MTATNDTRAALHRIIWKFAPRKRLEDSTALLHDLSIAGDDAAELLDDVHKEFGTVFGGFVFDEYFPNETEIVFYSMAGLFGFKTSKKPLTIGHLLEVIESGRWIGP